MRRFLFSQTISFLFVVILVFSYLYYLKAFEIAFVMRYLMVLFIIWIGFIILVTHYLKSPKESELKRNLRKFTERYPKVALINLILLGAIGLILLSTSLSILILISLCFFATGLLFIGFGILILYSPRKPEFYKLAVILSMGIISVFLKKKPEHERLKKIHVYLNGLLFVIIGAAFLVAALIMPV
ncbi:MAG: hypothetical protein DRP12_01320 [Candidatus Aenigmatarchaeota archaeon]|nr:MAG: hypothetical protein DRP12_01320 [Candidatus Aenigmarchaeota archaeon]